MSRQHRSPSRRCHFKSAGRAGLLFFLGLLTLPTAQLVSADEAASGDGAEIRSAEDLLIVDCLLPQKVRRLGRETTFLAPRQPIRTTAADCRIRGGEYTEPDQASYATALAVWLPQAKAGDAEAQFYVGQIFERGLGTTADYESAGVWYRRAAEQDYTPAQVSLGFLYEEGLGVEASEEEALRWYRRAAGLTDDMVLMEASRFESIRSELAQKEAQIELLSRQVDALTRQLEKAQAQTDEEKVQQEAMRSLLESLQARLHEAQAEAAVSQARLAELRSVPARGAESAAAQAGTAAAAGTDLLATLSQLIEGENHALIIGNSHYQKLPELAGASDDAQRVADVLTSRYGFQVRLLLDADRYAILSALNELRGSLSSKDRLVVYYTGHGQRQIEGRDAWWQPVDADPKNPVNWIPSALISEHLDLMAPNHVLLLANAVFGGLRTRSSVARRPTGMTPDERVSHVRRLLERRTRLVLSATDADGRPDAGFNDALVAALEANDGGVLEASRLYEEVNESLFEQRGDASNLEFATLRWARNDLSDFFFVPQTR